MARISRSKSIGTSVTRQDLYDLIATSRLKDISTSDLTFDVQSVLGGNIAASVAPSAPDPGQLWYDSVENLFKIAVYDSGSSSPVWYAAGPDSFDFVARAVHPIPRGAAVQIAFDHVASDPTGLPYVVTATCPTYASLEAGLWCVGFTRTTAASGGLVPVTYFGFALVKFYEGGSRNGTNLPIRLNTVYPGYLVADTTAAISNSFNLGYPVETIPSGDRLVYIVAHGPARFTTS